MMIFTPTKIMVKLGNRAIKNGGQGLPGFLFRVPWVVPIDSNLDPKQGYFKGSLSARGHLYGSYFGLSPFPAIVTTRIGENYYMLRIGDSEVNRLICHKKLGRGTTQMIFVGQHGVPCFFQDANP